MFGNTFEKPTITNKELKKAQEKAIADMKAEGVNPADFEGQTMDENFDIKKALGITDNENAPEESVM